MSAIGAVGHFVLVLGEWIVWRLLSFAITGTISDISLMTLFWIMVPVHFILAMSLTEH